MAVEDDNSTLSITERGCLRRYPGGVASVGMEDCLTLTVHTSSVVYEELAPVVVVVGGDDTDEEEEETLRPSAGEFLHLESSSILKGML